MGKSIRVGSGLMLAVWLLGSATVQAALVPVTIHNQPGSTYLSLYSPSVGFVSAAFGGYAAASDTTFMLNDAYTYYLGSYLHVTAGTHPFTISGGQVIPGGNAPQESEFFRVYGNHIYVHGIKLSVRFVSSPNNNPYQYVQFNAGGLNGPTVAPLLGGPALTVGNFLPADTNFDGSAYHLYFPSVPWSADSAMLRLGTNDGIADFVGTGASFVRSGQYSILATLSNGNVFEFTAVPEPSSLAMVTLVAAGFVALRARRLRS